MGMYTAIATSITFKENTPKEIIDMIQYLVDGDWDKEPKLKPNHYFFKCDRWDCVFSMDSAYFDFETTQFFDGKNLNTIANLKNYGNPQPIQSFFEWIWPYCDVSKSKIIGASQYEEYEESNIYLIDNNQLIINEGKVDFNDSLKIIEQRKIEYKNE